MPFFSPKYGFHMLICNGQVKEELAGDSDFLKPYSVKADTPAAS